MKLYYIPGVNGLGKTKGVENNLKYFPKKYVFESADLDNTNVNKQLSQIESKAKEIVKERFYILGGDHSISYPLVKSFFEKYNQDARLVVFDAHPDLMKPMAEPTHEEWLRALLERGFRIENVLLVGVRRNSKNIDKKEISFAERNKIKIIYADEFEKRKKEIFNFVSEGKIYLSLDVDVFDSSLVFSTGYPEEGGLNEKQVFSVLKKIKNKIVGGDLVEINLNLGIKKDKLKTLNVARKVLKTVFGK